MSSIIKPVLGSQLNFGHPLSNGLVGCWPFNEGSGGQVFDLSGNGNTGTLVGSLSWSAGQYGSCIDSPGAGSYVLAPFSTTLSYPFSYTIWYRQNTAQDAWIVGIADSSAGDEYVGIFLNEVGGATWVRHQQTNSGGNLYEQKAVDIGNNLWQFIAVVEHSTTSTDIYLNGSLWFNNPDDFTPSVSSFDRFGILCTPDSSPGSNFDGQSQIASLYNRALTASEIALLYREPFCMFERELIELWAAATQGAAGINIPLVMQQMNHFNGGMAA